MSTQTFGQVPIEQVRDFWDRRPCNIRHSTKPPGSREFFDEVEQRKYFVEPHIPQFAEFPRWQNKRVLEIGCGIGTDALSVPWVFDVTLRSGRALLSVTVHRGRNELQMAGLFH